MGAADNNGTISMCEVCHALNEYAPQAIWALEAKRQFLEDSLEWLELRTLI